MEKTPCTWAEEPMCREPWHLDDDTYDIPYCDACGCYRITVHGQRKAAEPLTTP
jgi:hypothetical protein